MNKAAFSVIPAKIVPDRGHVAGIHGGMDPGMRDCQEISGIAALLAPFETPPAGGSSGQGSCLEGCTSLIQPIVDFLTAL